MFEMMKKLLVGKISQPKMPRQHGAGGFERTRGTTYAWQGVSKRQGDGATIQHYTAVPMGKYPKRVV
jgi:hypothetical protein